MLTFAASLELAVRHFIVGVPSMEASDIVRIKELERKNSKLKQMYADLSLENLIIKEALEKKF